MAITTTALINYIQTGEPNNLYVNVTLEGDMSTALWLTLPKSTTVGPSLDTAIAESVQAFLLSQAHVVPLTDMALIWQLPAVQS